MTRRPRVRLGTNPIAWSNDDLRTLGDDTPLRTCLREARAAGYAGIELGHKFPRTPERLAPVLAAHSLALVSGWYSTSLLRHGPREEWVRMAGHLDLLQALGSTVMICAETTGAVHGARAVPLAARPRLDREGFTRLATGLTELAGRLADWGVALAYHHHMGTVVESASDIEAIMSQTGDAVGLLLDSGHARFAGIDPSALAADFAPRVTHVHCKDVRMPVLESTLAADRSFLDAVVDGVFTVPGDGAVDFGEVLAPLAAAGYEGWLVVEAEQDPAVADPFTFARMGFDQLRRAAARAGFEIVGEGGNEGERQAEGGDGDEY